MRVYILNALGSVSNKVSKTLSFLSNQKKVKSKMTEVPKDLTLFNEKNIIEFLNSFDTVFTDCDGVIWHGNDPIENANILLNRLKNLGKNVIYITNNSSRSREEVLVKLRQNGFCANLEEIINPPYLVAEYLNRLNFKKKVYVIGKKGINDELDKFGIRHFGVGPDILDTDFFTYIKREMKLDPEVGAVIVGFDEHFSFPKIMKAINYLNDKNCFLIATEPDEIFDYKGITFPLAGSLVQCLIKATKRNAYYVGKPSDHIVEMVKKNYPTNPSRTLMIGDNCETDILFGKKCGFKTLLVLSGVTTREQMLQLSKSENSNFIPDYYLNALGNLVERIPSTL